MKLFGWMKGRQRESENDRRRWRDAWAQAVEAEDASRRDALKVELDALPLPPGDDTEIETEMLDALERLGTLRHETAGGTLPAIETHHRVLAGDRCHFTAPASLPDDPAQASGRLLFTPTRSIFVGGGRPHPLPWHTIRDVVRAERDVLFVRADGTPAAHFRFNTFGDAVAAVFLARRLKGARPTRTL